MTGEMPVQNQNLNSMKHLTQADRGLLMLYAVYAFPYQCTEMMLMKMCAHYSLHNL